MDCFVGQRCVIVGRQNERVIEHSWDGFSHRNKTRDKSDQVNGTKDSMTDALRQNDDKAGR